MRRWILLAFLAAFAGCGPAESVPQEPVPVYEEKAPPAPENVDPNAPRVQAS